MNITEVLEDREGVEIRSDCRSSSIETTGF
jgi:hypothetical protein